MAATNTSDDSASELTSAYREMVLAAFASQAVDVGAVSADDASRWLALQHAAADQGRFNAAFFKLMGGYINWHLRDHKSRVFADLPRTVVELGSGVGANLRYLPEGGRLVAVEPNPHMHSTLAKAAAQHGVELEIRDVVGERIDLPDTSVDAVISSLVLCTVSDPARSWLRCAAFCVPAAGTPT